MEISLEEKLLNFMRIISDRLNTIEQQQQASEYRFNERFNSIEQQLKELKQNKTHISEDDDEDITVIIFESMEKLTQRVEIVETNLSSFTTNDELEQKISAFDKVQQQQINILTTTTKTLEKTMSINREKYTKSLSSLRETLEDFKKDVKKNASQLEENFIRKHIKLKDDVNKNAADTFGGINKSCDNLALKIDAMQVDCRSVVKAISAWTKKAVDRMDQVQEEISLQRQ